MKCKGTFNLKPQMDLQIMKRRHFIKSTGLMGMGVTFIPKLVLQQNKQLMSYNDLIGKGNPKVFGNGYKLRKEAHNAFLVMSAEEEEEVVPLTIDDIPC